MQLAVTYFLISDKLFPNSLLLLSPFANINLSEKDFQVIKISNFNK